MANVLRSKDARDDDDWRELLKRRTRSSAERNAGHLRLLRKFWRYYLSSMEGTGRFWRRENDRDPGAGADWRANLFVPASFSVVETAVPRIVFALFGTHPYVKARGRERADMEAAPAIEAMLQYDFEQTQLITKAVDYFKSLYIFGTAVGRIDYHRDFYELKGPPQYTIDLDVDEAGEIVEAKPKRVRNSRRVMRHDGPRYTNVSLFNFFPDPEYQSIDQMRYCVEREETTLEQLEAENARWAKLTGKPKYKNLSKVKPYKEGQMEDFGSAEDMREDTAEVMRFNWGYGGGVSTKGEKDDDTVLLYHYWEPDRYVVMANGHEIILRGDNPYNDKRLPFVASQCFPTLQEFYGQGLVAPIQFLQEELNTLRNIALDQGKMNLMGVWAIDEGITLSDADVTIFPGKFIQTEFQGGKPQIENVFQNTLPSDYERLESRTQQDIQSTLAINDYMVGAGGGSAGTASEAAMMNASAANRFRLQAMLAQGTFVETTASMFLSRRQQFLDRRRVFRVLGRQGYDYPEIGPEDIWGEYDFEPQGSQSQPNKEVLRQQMIQLMTVAAGNPTTMAMTNWPEVYKELWSMFDFRFPERFMLTPPEKQITQRQENMILMQGEKVAVEPNEPHDQHVQEMYEILPDAEGADERIREAVQDHMEQHQRYLQAQQQTPQAQTPGNVSGAEGNVPADAGQSVPTMPQMQANVMGGPGGPIA